MILQDGAQVRSEAARIVRKGGLLAFRTDTFYGLGTDPLNANAVRKIRELKGREEAKPILLLISDLEYVNRFVLQRSEMFDAIARRHWPGPITLIGAACPELSDELTSGTGTIGVRLPDAEDVRLLVQACGGALTATSANLSGSPPARSASDVEHSFPVGIDLIIDSGEVDVTAPSTVLDLTSEEPRLIREGAIRREELALTLAGLK